MMRKYTEVYDLNTTIGSMTMLAIHTPQAHSLKKMFKGHFLNYKKYKVVSCDIQIACASQLPLSPDQVGLGAGEVDPRDVMNPMLFKACTGENLNALLNQVYNKTEERADMFGETEGSVGEHKISDVNARRAYYQLLSDPTWRKAHPQAGLTIRNLKPYVHKVATTQPFKWTGLRAGSYSTSGNVTDRPMINTISGTPSQTDSAQGAYGFGSPSGTETDTNGNWDATNPSVFVSNGITPMPWLDTAVPQNVPINTESTTPATKQANWLITNIPRVYCGVLLMPPAVSTKFYMRAVFTWHIAFKDWRPAYEIGAIPDFEFIDSENGMISSGSTTGWSTYFNYYHDAETKELMEKNDETCKDESSFTTNGVDDSEMVYAS